MGSVPREELMRDRLKSMERRIETLERATSLASASIGEGGLVIRDGGSLVISGEGEARSSNFVSDEHGWRIDGDGNAEFNEIIVREGIISPNALSYRTDTATKGDSWVPGSVTNGFSRNFSMTVPQWATSTSVIAIGTIGMNEGNAGVRFTGQVIIDGDAVAGLTGSVGNSSTFDTVTVTHHRSWSPTGSFQVEVTAGSAPLGETPYWYAQLTAMAVFTRGE